MWAWRKKERRRILEPWWHVGLEEKREKKNPRAVVVLGLYGKSERCVMVHMDSKM